MPKLKSNAKTQPPKGSAGANGNRSEDREREGNRGSRRRNMFGYAKHGKGKPSGGGMPYPVETNIEPPEKWGRA